MSLAERAEQAPLAGNLPTSWEARPRGRRTPRSPSALKEALSNVKTSTLLALAFVSITAALANAAPLEMKGAAILPHPCGQVAVKHMGLIHAGNMDDAAKLGTTEMQKQWKAMPAKDRDMMTEMMKAMAMPEDQLSAEITADGVLSIDGPNATLTVRKEHKDQSGSSTETWTQKYVIDGANCAISR